MSAPQFRRRQLCAALALLPLAPWLGACTSTGTGISSAGDAPLAPLPEQTPPSLGELMAAHFKVGAAIEPEQLHRAPDAAVVARQFTSLTAENRMKPGTIGVAEGQYNFAPADEIIAFAQTHGIAVRGHTLVWHFQNEAPAWFFAGDSQDPQYRHQVAARLTRYITDVVTHFRGKVYAWDVVNEVISDDPHTIYREDSPWYQALGKDYIALAFRTARAADPDVKLYINDYSTDQSNKRQRLLSVVRELQAQGVPIDGVGHQTHINVDSPPLSHVKQALVDVAALGLENQITELDISLYDDPGACWNDSSLCRPDYGSHVPNHVMRKQAERYRELFEIFKADTSIKAVTFWGFTDKHTWLLTVPAPRNNLPLLFDADLKPKAAFWAIVDPSYPV